MKHPISEIAFTPIVKVAQEKRGSRTSYAKMEQRVICISFPSDMILCHA